MPKKSRKEIEKALLQITDEIRHNKSNKLYVKKVKEEMAKYEYLAGTVQRYIKNTEQEIEDMDTRTICLLFECIFEVTNIPMALPNHYFTENEIKTSRQFTGDLQRDEKITFPYTVDNVEKFGKNIFIATFHVTLIKQLMDSMQLHYNFTTQREAQVIEKSGQIIYEPTVNQQNIDEMAELLKSEELFPNALIFNGGVRTGDNGDEFSYNPETRQLTILKGTKLDIIDGYHRTKAIQKALMDNPNIDMSFPVILTNLKESDAQKFLGQMSKAMPISKVRAKELSKERLADEVVDDLKKETELKGKNGVSRVSQSQHVKYSAGELVSYNVLSDTIDEVFEMKTKADVMDVSDWLIDFFNYLMGSFPNEFIDNIEKTNRESLINENSMFVGYISLAKKMMDQDIKLRKVKNIINDIDFSRNNSMWSELDIYKDGKLTKNARKNIKKYFEELDLKEGVLNG